MTLCQRVGEHDRGRTLMGPCTGQTRGALAARLPIGTGRRVGCPPLRMQYPAVLVHGCRARIRPRVRHVCIYVTHSYDYITETVLKIRAVDLTVVNGKCLCDCHTDQGIAARQRALDRGYRGSRPPQPRDQSIHSTNKRRYFQYAVHSTQGGASRFKTTVT